MTPARYASRVRALLRDCGDADRTWNALHQAAHIVAALELPALDVIEADINGVSITAAGAPRQRAVFYAAGVAALELAAPGEPMFDLGDDRRDAAHWAVRGWRDRSPDDAIARAHRLARNLVLREADDVLSLARTLSRFSATPA